MLRLPRSYVDQMVAHARAGLPNEACGVIAGRDGAPAKIYLTANAEQSPYRYNIDPRELKVIYDEMDEQGWEMLVVFHSHVATEAYPSRTDVRLAVWFPEAHYVIISLAEDEPSIRSFRIVDGEVTEEELEIVAGD